MDFEHAAEMLTELGSPIRLAALHYLLLAGEDGLTAGELQSRLAIPKSTLSHHVQHLVNAGLVSRIREGRNRRCRANRAAMQDLIAFLLRDCDDGSEARKGAAA